MKNVKILEHVAKVFDHLQKCLAALYNLEIVTKAF